ncbi:hypothetical protein CKK33_00855 [Mucilaginibacter sp. MD40]|nr:hypothetical protein CKK33_00855 [Mucilaginibacter sp. MD40]
MLDKVFRYFLSCCIILFLIAGNKGYAQVTPADTVKADSLGKQGKKIIKPDNTAGQYDFGDLVKAILHPHKKADSVKKKSSGITIIPNLASNPSIGTQIGIKAVAGKVLGSDPNTLLSVAATSASITTKNIIYFYLTHNVYTPGNKWNFQGSLVAAKTVTPDFGIGIGNADNSTTENLVLSNPGRKPYVLNAQYYSFREKVYKQIDKGLFVGAGVSFDIRRKIYDKFNADSVLTPYRIYNARNGFDNDHYAANGFLANIQYTTRDNQNRAYKGMYVDAGIRLNQTWLGSTRNAAIITTDFRKYFSLSSSHPEHVLAFWNWSTFVVGGALPYLELPGTGRDPNFRSGRGYTVTYFKGTQYMDTEVEYRFPILRNKFLSGVTFFSLQTANDDLGTKLFSVWQPGGGAGLRVLFNKATRTNLCIDYAWGKYGAHGLFLGLNEAF